MLWCPAYGVERGNIIQLQQPYIEEEDDIVGKYLFENGYIEKTKREIYKFWTIRERERERESIRFLRLQKKYAGPTQELPASAMCLDVI